jgi:peptidoglycan/LPS O-acetylase OafA/YrhL
MVRRDLPDPGARGRRVGALHVLFMVGVFPGSSAQALEFRRSGERGGPGARPQDASGKGIEDLEGNRMKCSLGTWQPDCIQLRAVDEIDISTRLTKSERKRNGKQSRREDIVRGPSRPGCNCDCLDDRGEAMTKCAPGVSLPVKERNQSLDVLRGVAILLVLGSHFPFYATWARIGWVGVYLFFVLSGFLVSGILFESHRKTGSVDVGRFVIRRGFKIWPSFYLYLIAVAILMLVTQAFNLEVLVSAGMFLLNYGGAFNGFTGHLWSLCVEEHFYLFLPVLFWISVRAFGNKRGPQFIGWISFLFLPLCLAFRLAVIREGHPSGQSHLLFDNLFCGVGISYLYRFRPRIFRLFSTNWSPAIALFLLIPVITGDHATRFVQTFGLTGASLGFAFLLAWAIDRRATSNFGSRISSGLAGIGFYSYSIYLWHLIARFLIPERFGVNFTTFWIYVSLSIFFGKIMSKYTERPSLQVRDRLFPEISVRDACSSVKQ